MKGLVVAGLSCLALLLQFSSVICDDRMVDFRSDNEDRTRRYHESDCLKERLKNKQHSIAKNTITIGQKPKYAPKSVLKENLPINERNEPKNVANINHILQEIANVAHNPNETRGIQKIRHLVEEIAKQEEKKSKFGKSSSKEQIENNVIVSKPKNHAKSKDAGNKSLLDSSIVLEKVSNKELTYPIITENVAEITKPLLTSDRRFNNKMDKHSDEVTVPLESDTVQKNIANEKLNPIKIENAAEVTKPLFISDRRCNSAVQALVDEAAGNNYDYKKLDAIDENLIEIKEHKYEEEMLHSSSYKNNEDFTYINCYTGQSFNPGYCNGPYDNNKNDIKMYDINDFNYPSWTYGDSNSPNKEYYVFNFNNNSEQSDEGVDDYLTHRKTWLDRETKIATRHPYEYDERERVITNERCPDFCRKYYRVRTNQSSNSNRALNNQYAYYKDRYQCS